MSNEKNIDDMTAVELRDHYKKLRLQQLDCLPEERKLLLEKIVLDSGTVADSYSVYLLKNKWNYICHVCDLNGKIWKPFMTHLNGKVHREMRRTKVNTEERFGIKLVEGFNGKYLRGGWIEDKNTLFSKATANHDGPLIGTEYLVELVDKQPLENMFLISETADYVCLLCDEEGDFKTTLDHLSSPEHCWTYMEKFFPKAVAKIEKLDATDITKQKLMFHVAAKVEFDYGRIKVNQVVKSIYQQIKQVIFDKVEREVHMRELPERDYTGCADITHLLPGRCHVGWLNRQKDINKGGKPQLRVPPPMTGPPPMTKKRRLALARKFREEDKVQINNDKSYNRTYTDHQSDPARSRTLPDKEYPKPAQPHRPQNSNIQPSGSNLPNQGNVRGPQENIVPSNRPQSPQTHQRDPKTLPGHSSSFKDNSTSSTKLTLEQNKKSGIMSVLRTLSVLETELGTLGPKAINLLKEAIRLEKSTVNGAEVLITREQNLLETIKEKLVGSLDALLINENLIAATKDVVAKIESLISASQLKETFSSGTGTQSSNEATYGQAISNQSGNFSNDYGDKPQSSQDYDRRPNKEVGAKPASLMSPPQLKESFSSGGRTQSLNATYAQTISNQSGNFSNDYGDKPKSYQDYDRRPNKEVGAKPASLMSAPQLKESFSSGDRTQSLNATYAQTISNQSGNFSNDYDNNRQSSQDYYRRPNSFTKDVGAESQMSAPQLKESFSSGDRTQSLNEATYAQTISNRSGNFSNDYGDNRQNSQDYYRRPNSFTKDVRAESQMSAPQLKESFSSGDRAQSLNEATYRQTISNQSGNYSNDYGDNRQSSQDYHRRPNSFTKDVVPSGDRSQSLNEATYGQTISNQSGNFSNDYADNRQGSQDYHRRPNRFDQSPGSSYNEDSRWPQEKRQDNSMPTRGYSQDNYKAHRDRYTSNSKPYDRFQNRKY